ncbi:DNA-binding LacI/PurR family transcriptional regulator [Paenibacillus brasilensis]|uniref:DNA-binding LacI/PurR family transcriptional regulator n=1 Tax=Paenibacillus brasilensis TaxID=128574 RepID=A0ABU0L7M5_9BACL|nr:hypothetical protein [Paenibacillus brasilensis]MDQ0497272.1 DNA-binding LacI/PurR family transcriptional regulator [Paenibacillus brasilensis]
MLSHQKVKSGVSQWSYKVAGIVGITYNDIENSVSNDIPILSIDRHFNKKITCVTSDNYEGGRLALKELVKAGAQRPAFMGSVTSVFSETMNRRKGFIDEAKKLGVDYVVYEKPDCGRRCLFWRISI